MGDGNEKNNYTCTYTVHVALALIKVGIKVIFYDCVHKGDNCMTWNLYKLFEW